MSDSQSMNTHQESMLQDSDSFIISIFKVLGHGVIVLFGLIGLTDYFEILGINLWLGNYILFLPLLLFLLIPFVLIVLGALNSYSVGYIYSRKSDSAWYSFLIQGILVCFIGFLFTSAYTILIVYFVGFQWPPFYYNFSLIFIIFYLLLIPSIGYVTKEMTIVLFARIKDSKEQSNIEE